MRPRLVYLGLAVVVASGIVFAHRVDAFHDPQFYAEDGARWFSDAYTVGAVRALGLSWAGYLQLVSRIGPLVATPFGIAGQPLVYNVCGLAVQIAPVIFFLSTRFDAVVPSFTARVALSAAYLLLPVEELNVNITGAPYHLIILATLVLVAADPRRWYWKAFDLGAVLLCGLSGPFVYLLLPVALLWYVVRRRRFTLMISAVLAVTLLAQLSARQFSPRLAVELGANVKDFVLIVCDRIVLAGLFAEPAQRHLYVAGHPWGPLVAGIVCVIAILFVAYAAWKAPWELRVFALVAFGIVSGAGVATRIATGDRVGGTRHKRIRRAILPHGLCRPAGDTGVVSVHVATRVDDASRLGRRRARVHIRHSDVGICTIHRRSLAAGGSHHHDRRPGHEARAADPARRWWLVHRHQDAMKVRKRRLPPGARAGSPIVVERFALEYGDAHTELAFGRRGIARIGDPQRADDRCDGQRGDTRALRSVPQPEALAAAPQDVVEEIIHRTGFFHSKARAIIEMSQT